LRVLAAAAYTRMFTLLTYSHLRRLKFKTTQTLAVLSIGQILVQQSSNVTGRKHRHLTQFAMLWSCGVASALVFELETLISVATVCGTLSLRVPRSLARQQSAGACLPVFQSCNQLTETQRQGSLTPCTKKRRSNLHAPTSAEAVLTLLPPKIPDSKSCKWQPSCGCGEGDLLWKASLPVPGLVRSFEPRS